MVELRHKGSSLLLVSYLSKNKFKIFFIDVVLLSFGAAFTTFYRLFGPYRSTVAPEIIKTELWETITRRGVIGNVTMGLIPMIFYLTLNFSAFSLDIVWHIIQLAVGKPSV